MKTNLLLTLSLLAAVVLLQGCQLEPQGGQKVEGWATKIGGSYKGPIMSGNTEYPGVTKFNVGSGDMLTGSYSYTEDGATVKGKLSGFKVAGDCKLECKWEDPNGVGDFKLTFNKELNAFTGSWTTDAGGAENAWNGKK